MQTGKKQIQKNDRVLLMMIREEEKQVKNEGTEKGLLLKA